MQGIQKAALQIQAEETTTPIVVKCEHAPAGQREFSITWEELATLKVLAQERLQERLQEK